MGDATLGRDGEIDRSGRRSSPAQPVACRGADRDRGSGLAARQRSPSPPWTRWVIFPLERAGTSLPVSSTMRALHGGGRPSMQAPAIFSGVRAIVFDLAGTLIDSYEAITESLNYALGLAG